MVNGLEIISNEYSRAGVKAMIESTTRDYVGANIDSVTDAQPIGISADRAADYTHDRAGVSNSFDKMGAAANAVRKTGRVGAIN